MAAALADEPIGLVAGAIGLELVDEPPRRLDRIECREHARAEHDQTRRFWQATDQLAQRHEQTPGIVREGVQSGYGLGDEHPVGGAAGAGHIAQAFDRVHTPSLPATVRRLEAVRLPPASATVSAVAVLDGDPDLDPINGDPRPFTDWLTTFPMLVGAIDPYTHESSWLLDTIRRVFAHFREAGVRVAWLATAPPEGTKAFLGPYAEEFLTFSDPDATATKALGLTMLPALAFVKQDGTIAAVAEGWDPDGWRDVTDAIEAITDWTSIAIPGPTDPAPYAGTPVA